MAPLRFDDRVVLVTGGGNGLGEQYALYFASRGAKVVVNDLGVDMRGTGASVKAADKVVQQIRTNGGTAVANYDSVEEGEKIVQTAIDNYGRIDIVVNNAGILRDKSFLRTSDNDWDIIHRVHLRGSFLVSRAAWPHMRKQNYGRIIMTASSAGLYGNFGQANYSAAKLGLLGLSNTLAIEGAKYNIKSNTIAPIAASRLTANILPEDILNAVKPNDIAPFVAWLCHENCPDTGGIYEGGGGQMSKLRWQKTKGVMMKEISKTFSIDDVAAQWDKICDFSKNASYPSTAAEGMGLMDAPEEGSSKTSDQQTFTYSTKDAILYALGVGVSTTQPGHLKFLFELNEDFCVLPTFGVIPDMVTGMDALSGPIEGIGTIDMTQVLHGEQYLELYKPLPSNATITCKTNICDVVDKGSSALLAVNGEIFDESGELLGITQKVIFIRNAGGFGGKRNSDKIRPIVKPPNRAPDSSFKEKTSIDQAALYRLSGDYNPLHIDPSFAAMGGLPKPILHGLASFGYAVRHVLKQYCDNDVSLFKAVKARFSKTVDPGQTIQTDMWKEGDRIHFESKVAETGQVCLTGAYVDLHKAKESSSDNQDGQTSDSTDMIFEAIKQHINEDGSLVKKINAIYLWNITRDKKVVSQWTVDLKNGKGSVYKGEPKEGKAGCVMTTNEEMFVKLSSGEVNGQQAFFQGKLKMQGNIMLAQKLGMLFARETKL